MREAEGAFGDPTVFIEQAVVDPRHIEVQILADGDGQRDPPLRARLLGAAPAPEGRRDRAGAQPRPRAAGADVRRRGAVRHARSATATPAPSSSCSTRDGNYVFIEMNPRIQVEHTVTEEVTDVDLVQSQLRIAAGETLADLGLSPGRRSRCAAPRCSAGSPPRTRPTASAPTPARSRPTAPPAARGVRLDGGTTYTGAEVSRALRLDAGQAHLPRPRPSTTRRRARRGGRWRSSGSAASSTNIAVPAGGARRPRLPRRPGHHRRSSRPTRSCSRPAASGDRGTKLLTYLADVTVNQPHGAAPVDARPGHQAARRRPRRSRRPTAPGSCCSSSGPEEFARAAARAADRVAVTDTTFRDAHQSLLATRVRTRDLLAVAGHVARTHARSCGRSRRGAARRTTWRCGSSPRTRGSGWPRCARRCRTSACRCCCAAATRSATRRTRPRSPTRSSQEAAETGIDVFRIFDALNDVEQMRPAIEAVRATGTDGRRGRALLHRRPVRPRREALHARLLPAAGRADRRRRRARAGDQGHGRAAAGAGRPHPGHRAARAVRPAGAPAHPRHPRRPARHPARRDRRRRRRGRRRLRLDGRHHLAAGAVRAGRGHRPLRPRDRADLDGGQRPGALLGGDPPGLRAVRVRAAVADRPGLPPRDPRRPALQPAPAGDRARARREVRADRGHVRRRQRHPRQHRQGDARPRRWSATSRCTSSAVGADPAEFADEPRRSSTSPTR